MVKIYNDYLRDTNEYLLDSDNGDTNPQAGKCNHFDTRHNGGKPLYVVQHHTVSDFDETIKTFTSLDNGPKVSANYVINTDGAIYALVDPQYRARHAGVGNISKESKWYNKDLPIDVDITNDMNNWSIGIENVNSGTEGFTYAQKQSNIFLCEYLCSEYNIDPKFIIGHADWTPGRKIDPSPYFFWEELSKAQDLYREDVTRNFGIYSPQSNIALRYEPDIILSYDCNNTDTMQVTEIQNKLKNLYIIDDEEGIFGSSTRDALLSFRIHFSGPDIIESPCQRQAWENLCIDNTADNRKFLGICTQNDLVHLDYILDHIKD